MMKNKLLFLVMLGFVVFVGCNDDDKDPFENYSADYSMDKLDLKLNGRSFTGASVSFSSADKKNATVVLKGLIPGESTLEVSNLLVTELNGDDYSFVGENKNDDRTISVEGTVNSGVLGLNTTFHVTSKVVGKWQWEEMKMNEDGMTAESSPLHFTIDTEVESINLPMSLFGSPVTVYLNKKDEMFQAPFPIIVQNIFDEYIVKTNLLRSLELKTTGNLVATYMPLQTKPGDELSQIPMELEEGLVRYNVKDGQIYLLLDLSLFEGLIKTSAANLGRENNQNTNVLLQMLTDGIPLKLIIGKNGFRAYMEREMLLAIMAYSDLFKTMAKDMKPIIYGDMFEISGELVVKFIDDLADLMKNSKSVELGVNFVTYEE